MKILRYLIFLSILSGIFFVIYRQSDEKGFRKCWTSLKIAVIMAAILAGLIPASTEAIEPSGNNNQVYQERLLLDQEFNSFEDNDQKVILVKTADNPPSVLTSPGRGQPSQFPTPSSGGRPNRPVYVPKYRTVPKVVGAAANPAGAGNGGGANWDNQCPVSKEQKSQESETFDYDYRLNNPKKKKKSAEQCEVDENIKDGRIEIVSRIKEDAGLVRAAEEACKNADVQKDVNHLEKQLANGNGTILEFQQEQVQITEHNINEPDDIILVKDDGILPGADGFPLNNNPRRRHPFGRPRMKGRGITVDPPQNIQGLGNISEAPKVRSFTEVDIGLNARRGNRGDQCPAPEFDMKKEYIMLMEDMSQKGIELECDQQRFNDLCVNQETGAIDEKSIFEPFSSS